MSNSLEILGKNRNSLLLAEVGCWLHMMGKLDVEFLVSQSKDKPETCKYNYQKCFLSRLNPKLRGLIEGSWVNPLLSSIPNIPISKSFPSDFSLFLFSTEHRNREVGTSILKMSVDAHGVASGIEKGTAVDEMSQSHKKTFISTSFGYEYRDIINNLCWAEIQNDAYTSLEKALTKIKDKTGNLSEDEWWDLIRDLREKLSISFRQVVGDTRRPLNHISLFDQTVSTVAFYKAELAHVVLDKWQDPLIPDFSKKYKFRLLRMKYNGFRFWGETDTIGDLIARRVLLDKMILHIERLITCRFPMGYLAYKDENDAVFLIPDDPINILSLKNGNQTLESLIKRGSSEITDGETIPVLKIEENENRWAANLGSILEVETEEPGIDTAKVAILWKDKSEEICTICKIRPIGVSSKAKKRKTCDVCLNRREKRSGKWSKELETTIWIDEVSDINGRIALIVGKFDIKNWINGQLINTLLGRLLPSLSPNWVQPNNNCEAITEEIRKELILDGIDKKTYLNALTKDTSIRKGLPKQNYVKALYELLVVHRDGIGQPLDDPPSIRNAELLFHAIFAQEQSCARVRRIWETTRRFWQDILSTEGDITQSEAKDIGMRGPRLLIKGDTNPDRNELGPYHAYELLFKEIKISVVWDKTREGFITADNLLYIANLLNIPDLKQEIKGILKIEEPSGYGAKDKEWGIIDVKEIEEIGEKYIPAIPLLAEPSTFMALVPADKAFDMIEIIKKKYEREMGKVRNRLPLTLGIIFTHQYTPLRIIIDAGQRMLTSMDIFTGQPAQWNVTKNQQGKSPFDDPHFTKTAQISIESQNKKLTWNVPLCMGDGSPDHWYPYVFMEEWDHSQRRNRSLKAPLPWNKELKWLFHAEDVREGDVIYFVPSLFDFEWLDASSRRFEIAHEDGRRLGEKGMRRPYLLENVEILEEIWNTLKETLTTSQIYALRDLIEQKRREWNPEYEDYSRHGPFWKFCRDALATSHWTTNPWEKGNIEEWLDTWADYAARGWLSDAIEIYMQIMKEKSQAGGVAHEY